MDLKLVIAVAALGVCFVAGQDAPIPVTELDVAKYIGNWYQVYTNKFSISSSQPNSTCATIQYGLFDASSVTVDNRFRSVTPTGELDRTTGKASLTETPGILEVKFDNVPASFKYYVIKTGPVENNMYSYAVVTDEGMRSLFLLARDVAAFRAGPEAEVLTFVEEQGFTTDMNSPILTEHSDECLYPKSFEEPTPVTSLDVDMYTGKYFMIYNNKNVDDRVSKDSRCATIEYGKLNATTISVKNRFRVGSPDGTLDTTGTGMAMATDVTGVFTVKFDNIPVIADYRVIKLGPVVDGKYDYSVITDIRKVSVFVIGRDVENFMDSYNEDVLEFLEMEGFDGLTNSPLEQYHATDCMYPAGFEYTSGASPVMSMGVMTALLVISSALLSL